MVLGLYKTDEKNRPRGGERLTLLFRVDRREGCEALGSFCNVFGVMAYPEAVTENLTALHLRPGHPACLRGEDEAPR